MKYILVFGGLFVVLIISSQVLQSLNLDGKYLPGRSVEGITKDAQSIGMTVFEPSQYPPVLQCSQTNGTCRVTLKVGLVDGRPFNFNCVVTSSDDSKCTSAAYDWFLAAAWLCDNKDDHDVTRDWVRRHATREGDTTIAGIRYFISQNAGSPIFRGATIPKKQ